MNLLAQLTPPRSVLLAKVKRIKGKMQELEALMLELNRHPDATMDMLRESHECHVRLTQKLREIEGRLAA